MRETKPLEAAAIVLAGGKSSRMGQDKSLMVFSGQPLVEHVVSQLLPLFQEVMVAADQPDKFGFLSCAIVPDEAPDQGPLMGIASCLSTSSHDLNFVTACDIPHMNLELIDTLIREAEGYGIAVPRSADGLLEPLFAVYRRSVIGPARALLAESRRGVRELFPLVKTRYVEMPGGWYRNLNTLSDYLDALACLEEASGESADVSPAVNACRRTARTRSISDGARIKS